MSLIPACRLVSTISDLHDCLQDVESVPPPAAVAVDLEGVNLGRGGRIAIMQLYALNSDTVWLVDITTLGHQTFNAVDARNKSLKSFLEGAHVRKVFWDVRNDSDALFALYNIGLKQVYDLQVVELANRHSRRQDTRLVHGLGKMMARYNLATPAWTRVKDEGVRLFAPEKGGSYDVFEARPLDPRIEAYCAQDVILTFRLETALKSSFGPGGSQKYETLIVRESAARVALSQTTSYQPYSRDKALAMINWSL